MAAASFDGRRDPAHARRRRGHGHGGFPRRRFVLGPPGRAARRLDHAGFGHRHQQQAGVPRGNVRLIQDGGQPARAIDAVDEAAFVRVFGQVLQPLAWIGAGRDVLTFEAFQHLVLPVAVVVTADAFQDQRGRGILQLDRLFRRTSSLGETKVARLPREQLVQLRFHLPQQGAGQVVGRQRPHLDQNRALVAALVAHAFQRFLQHRSVDQAARQQDLTKAFGQHVGPDRDGVAVLEVDDLLDPVAHHQQRAAAPLEVQPAQDAGERLACQRSAPTGHAVGQLARFFLDLAALAPLRRVGHAPGGVVRDPAGRRCRPWAVPSPARAPARCRGRAGCWTDTPPARNAAGLRCGVWPRETGWPRRRSGLSRSRDRGAGLRPRRNRCRRSRRCPG